MSQQPRGEGQWWTASQNYSSDLCETQLVFSFLQINSPPPFLTLPPPLSKATKPTSHRGLPECWAPRANSDELGVLAAPSISIIIRYYMDGEAGEHVEESRSEGLPSAEYSSSQQPEEPLSSDQKAEELRRSVERLRDFAASFSQEALRELPTCVEEYCDRIEEYRLRKDDCIVALAERRLNKMLRNRKIKRNWNGEDITLLVWLVSKRIQQMGLNHFSELEKQDWEFIAGMVSGSTWQKCKFRWLGLKKVRLVTHKWSKAESRLLAEAVAEQPKVHWKLVSQRLYERNPAKNKVFRTAKQCREHWNCFLNPNIHKGPWEPQEDRRLLEYVLELEGAKKWSEIAKFMAGRTENALKNRFNLLLGAQRKLSGNLTEKRLVRLCLSRLMLEQGQQEPLELQSLNQQTPEAAPLSHLPPVPAEQTNPIVPSVGERGSGNVGFRLCYDSVMGYLGNTMLPSPLMGNAYYIGYVFPQQF